MLGSKRREQFSIQALQFFDAFLVYGSFWLSDQLRPLVRPLLGMEQHDSIGLNALAWLLFIVVPFTPLILEFFGFYENLLRKTVAKSVSQMLRCLAVFTVFVAIMVVFFQVTPSSRLVLLMSGVFATLSLLLRDGFTRRLLKKSAIEGGGQQRVIIAGEPNEIEKLLAEMPDSVTDYWEVVAHYDMTKRTDDDLEEILTEKSVHQVVVAASHSVFEGISRVVELCEKRGVEAWVSAGFIRTQVSRPVFDTLGGNPMLVLRATPDLSWALLVKKVLDRVGAFVLIIATSPFWLFAMIGICFASPGAPIFFHQARAGKYGKEFKMWKFRTMVVDAEAKLAEVKQEMGNEMSGPVFKLEEDPRVFPFAKFLRKWSIDELPQLLNVLFGDMSLVGPRPLPVYEVKEFEKSEYRRRLSVKPGITCTWQAGGRNTITEWEDWVEMDLEYIDNWSLWLDIKLLIMTVPAVLFGVGAK